jgi:hypothetical protein
MDLDEARQHLHDLREVAGTFDTYDTPIAAERVLAHLDAVERRCEQVIGGYMPYRRADEVARWILTGNAEPS